MATLKVQTGLRLEEALYEKIKVLAENDGRSINNLIEQILRRYVADYEAQNGPLPLPRD